MPEQRRVRTALGAGRWFPADRQELGAMVSRFVDAADVPTLDGRLVSVISPHAGYEYSGAVAGYAFRAAREEAARHGTPEAVVILGFSHRTAFRGVTLLDGTAFATPLGLTPLDTEAAGLMTAADPRITLDHRPHVGEHSAENQVPFVQTVLPEAALVLAIMGGPDPTLAGMMASVLGRLASRKKVLVVASSDMLHDPDYERVCATDRATLTHVEALDSDGLREAWSYERQVFCGIGPVTAAMQFARQQGCTKGTVLRYRNSGDDHPESRGQWVVGYGAAAFAVDPARELRTGPARR